MNRKEFLRMTATASVAALMSPLSAWAESSYASDGKKIKVGVLGCGSVSNSYFPHITKCPYIEVVACCDIIPERAKSQAERFNVPKWYKHIDDMLKGSKFDLMLTLTDMQIHGELNRKALEAGRNVWSEKPMANTYREGKELMDLATAKGLRIWGAPAVVTSPQFEYMAKQVKNGALGSLACAHGHYGHEGPNWASFFYEKTGGSMPDLGVYNIATLTGLLGPAKSVVAMLSIVTPERDIVGKGKIKVEEEDNAMILMEHDKGVLSHIQCGFNYHDPYGHAGTGQSKSTISLYGSEGNMHMIGYDWAPGGVEITTMKDKAPRIVEKDTKGYVWPEGASDISKHMVLNTEPRINTEHALHVLEIIEAARLSQEQGKRIQLKSTFPWPMV
ncbi:putative dehydrogenase [Parabacteroides sp. PF5-5]|uniref:Gfo/Idh/MocA family protein n=2 Tax=Parabacteroides TaxID=375288 RepID=UPI002475D376|nr:MULTISPECIES: Gfo/Idh/MocA family oxidoreductase [unclassified Parabacteroides]MDH6361166.1 putative dehydrogenase [Parabacteroides sp. PH5-16]MDH6305443.1 putative dehydrogenase [Parabacteroides sp. PH5-39]MDH6316153.1 putative dehydrogenase [Parabacteroides sp. PF5-13]MDH6320303.1 putative dehydrogenase [Parabacteroides sp. PH5-13]MDH6324033.1 putative dehydrogenase [Parabacteroides sp. PH5-8]